MALFAIVKLIQMLNRHNPVISSFLTKGFYDSNKVLNFKQVGMRFAFGIEGFLDKKPKDDPRYVKGFARFMGNKDGEGYEKLIPYHKCTKDDFE